VAPKTARPGVQRREADMIFEVGKKLRALANREVAEAHGVG